MAAESALVAGLGLPSIVVTLATMVTWRTLRAEADDGAALDLAVRAVAADFTQTLPDEVREGRLFTAAEASRQAPVCLLSFEARVWLFGDAKVFVTEILKELPARAAA